MLGKKYLSLKKSISRGHAMRRTRLKILLQIIFTYSASLGIFTNLGCQNHVAIDPPSEPQLNAPAKIHTLAHPSQANSASTGQGATLAYVGQESVFARDVASHLDKTFYGAIDVAAHAQNTLKAALALPPTNTADMQPTDTADTVLAWALDTAANSIRLEQAASDAGIVVGTDEVDKAWNARMHAFSDQALKRHLGQAHITQAELKTRLRRYMRHMRYMQNHVHARVAIQSQELETYLKQSPQIEDALDTVWVGHIRMEDMDEADKLRDEIRRGLDFETAAKRHGQDPYAMRGGHMPPMQLQHFPAPIAQALKRLRVNRLSPVVHTENGYHILKMLRRKAPEPQDGIRLRRSAEMQLRLKKQAQAENAHLAMLAQKTPTKPAQIQ